MNTMKQTEYDLLKMRHARAVANIYQYAAQANRESALDGWLCDWAGAMRDANADALACEHEIECLISDLPNVKVRDAASDSHPLDTSRE